MGLVSKMLFSKKLEKKSPDYYPDKWSFEYNESFHVHLRNWRVEFFAKEWELFCQKVAAAYNYWHKLNKPKPGTSNNQTIYLPSAYDVDAEPDFTPDRFDIEQMQDNNNIHIHYRNLRIDFSKKEFMEFLNGIMIASAGLLCCISCGKDYVKFDEHTYKPECGCVPDTWRLSKG